MTGHSSATIKSYMKLFREMVASTLEDDDNRIGGPNVIVEIDETKMGKRKYHRGHRVDGVWVIGGVERTEEKGCFVEVVADRTADTLLEVISRHVLEGSIIYTDMWRGYNGLEGLNPVTGVHTNTIEGLWNGLKLRIPARDRTKDEVTNHLHEFVWRKKKNNIWGGFINALKTTSYPDPE
ncbi:14043_t:CDS:2 [Ambispora leptoticha]|uniref:14043_t:CDS:1 n=1 Tax=Ambispora leptoticha TaxID=144679 RepID=A0A9N9NC00_9GLOM|nr:14043_t:CDS:2 [Ambispora leptoticha]